MRFKLFAPKKELVAVSFPRTFSYHYDGGKKFAKHYQITLWIDNKGVRSYQRDLPKDVEKLMGSDTYLDYWVMTGTIDPQYEVWFDWKVTPKQLRQRYLAELLKN